MTPLCFDSLTLAEERLWKDELENLHERDGARGVMRVTQYQRQAVGRCSRTVADNVYPRDKAHRRDSSNTKLET